MKITTAQAPKLISDVLRAGHVPMVHGSPGTAKSDIVKAIAKKNNLILIDFRLSQADPTDMAGFPTLNKERMRSSYAPPEIFPIKGDKLPAGKNGWLLFLDEVNSAPLSVQAASYKLVLDKQVGKHDLHPKVHIVAAGNLSTDKAIVNRMSTAMQSRLVHFELETDYRVWLEWANQAGIDFRICAFINFKPDILFNFNPNHSDFTFACPRTYEFASDLIKDYVDIPQEKLPLLTGTLGEAAGREFYSFSQVFKQLPTIETIIANPTGIDMPDEPSTQYAISGLLGHNLDRHNADSLMKFLERMPVEFQIMTLQAALKKSKKLLSVSSVKKWISVNSRDLFQNI